MPKRRVRYSALIDLFETSLSSLGTYLVPYQVPMVLGIRLVVKSVNGRDKSRKTNILLVLIVHYLLV